MISIMFMIKIMSMTLHLLFCVYTLFFLFEIRWVWISSWEHCIFNCLYVAAKWLFKNRIKLKYWILFRIYFYSRRLLSTYFSFWKLLVYDIYMANGLWTWWMWLISFAVQFASITRKMKSLKLVFGCLECFILSCISSMKIKMLFGDSGW
jgi:hypothetical protein